MESLQRELLRYQLRVVVSAYVSSQPAHGYGDDGERMASCERGNSVGEEVCEQSRDPEVPMVFETPKGSLEGTFVGKQRVGSGTRVVGEWGALVHAGSAHPRRTLGEHQTTTCAACSVAKEDGRHASSVAIECALLQEISKKIRIDLTQKQESCGKIVGHRRVRRRQKRHKFGFRAFSVDFVAIHRASEYWST